MKRSLANVALAAVTGLLIAGCPAASSDGELPGPDSLAIFHNGAGPMCLEALTWLDTMQSEYPGLVVEEYLTTDAAALLLLGQLEMQHGQSQGASTNFGYLPLIFYGGQAFSGFNDEVREALDTLLDSMNTPSS